MSEFKPAWVLMDFNDIWYYDENSPSGIRWKIDVWSGEDYRAKRVSVGDVAGTLGKKGYWNVISKKHAYRVSRVIWSMRYGEIARGLQVDHINKIRSDNRIENLRLVTNQVNKMNSGIYANNSSGKTGVRFIMMGTTLYCCATWAELSRKRKCAYYSTKKYGLLPAFKMACERRDREIELLNEQGGSYTESHGK